MLRKGYKISTNGQISTPLQIGSNSSSSSASASSSSASTSSSSASDSSKSSAKDNKNSTGIGLHPNVNVNPDYQSHLYPKLDDPNFQEKISQKKEFYNTRAIIHPNLNSDDVEKISDEMTNRKFEVAPHQLFVKSFISFNTPYRGLLLFHGLGSGKTCSAINVCEAMRRYYKSISIKKKIMIVASPNVQNEFQKQLFDPRKLFKNNGIWTSQTCVGSELIHEVNQSASTSIKENIMTKQINKIIQNSYNFVGYLKFANIVKEEAGIEDLNTFQPEKLSHEAIRQIRDKLVKRFKYSLIIFDEAHNLRDNAANLKGDNKKVANALNILLHYVKKMKILLMSATPMYNSPQEIISIINILRKNDGRPILRASEVFTSDGDFRVTDDGDEVGKRLLKSFVTGYISYVKGDNPFTFPYRIYPGINAPEHSIISREVGFQYDVYGKRTQKLTRPIQNIDVFLNRASRFHSYCYLDLISQANRLEKHDDAEGFEEFDNETGRIDFSMQQSLIYSLLIVYPKRNNLNKSSPVIASLHHEADSESRVAESLNENTNTTNPNIQMVQMDDDAMKEELETNASDSDTATDTDSEFESDNNDDNNVIRMTGGAEENSSESDSESSSGYESSDESDENEKEDANTKKDTITNALGDADMDISTRGRMRIDETYMDEEVRDRYEIGKNGINMVLSNERSTEGMWKYRYNEHYDGFFKSKSMATYGVKIHELVERIRVSTGIVLVYTEYIEGGVIPICLALEELGIQRYHNSYNLFENAPMEQVHYRGMFTKRELKKMEPMQSFRPATYTIFSGNETISPPSMRIQELSVLSSDKNKNGEYIKVVVITQSAAEGVDFKNIRQVHIMEPWYNIYRLEQIIGRAVRFLSHKKLPFNERNVEIYMHGTLLSEDEEKILWQMTADIQMYMIAEKKAIKISKVTRLIKESAVDCVLNKAMQEYTEERINYTTTLKTSSGTEVEFKVGDKKGSILCDFMDDCKYNCDASDKLDYTKIKGDVDGNVDEADIDYGTYNEESLYINMKMLIERIREIFNTGFEFHRNDIVRQIQAQRYYPLTEIDAALDLVVNDKYMYMYDKYLRPGNVLRLGDYYVFHPIEMTNQYLTRDEFEVPIYFKHTDFTPAKYLSAYKNSMSHSNSQTSFFSSSASSQSPVSELALTSSENQDDDSIRIGVNSALLNTRIDSRDTDSAKKASKLKFKILTRSSSIDDVFEFLQNCEHMYDIAMERTSRATDMYDRYHKMNVVKKLPYTSIYNRNWYFAFHEMFALDTKRESSSKVYVKKLGLEMKEHEASRIIIMHMLDQFNIRHILLVRNYLEKKEGTEMSEFEKLLMMQMKNEERDMMSITGEVNSTFLAYDMMKDKEVIIQRHRNGEWAELDEGLNYILMKEIRGEVSERIESGSLYSGYMIRNEYKMDRIRYDMIFKIWDREKSDKALNRGFRCENKGISELIRLLNLILETGGYYNKGRVGDLDKNQYIVLIECVLRLFEIRKRNNMYWFFRPYEMVMRGNGITI